MYFDRTNFHLFSMMDLIQKLSECILINVFFRNKEIAAIKFSSTRTYLPPQVWKIVFNLLKTLVTFNFINKWVIHMRVKNTLIKLLLRYNSFRINHYQCNGPKSYFNRSATRGILLSTGKLVCIYCIAFI